MSWLRLEPRLESDGSPVEGYRWTLALDFDPDAYSAEMTATYRCTGYMALIGGVTQPNPNRAGGDLAYIEDYFSVACTGRWEHVAIHLHYPTFAETGLEPGPADAYLGIDGGVTITKKVRL